MDDHETTVPSQVISLELVRSNRAEHTVGERRALLPADGDKLVLLNDTIVLKQIELGKLVLLSRGLQGALIDPQKQAELGALEEQRYALAVQLKALHESVLQIAREAAVQVGIDPNHETQRWCLDIPTRLFLRTV